MLEDDSLSVCSLLLEVRNVINLEVVELRLRLNLAFAIKMFNLNLIDKFRSQIQSSSDHCHCVISI